MDLVYLNGKWRLRAERDKFFEEMEQVRAAMAKRPEYRTWGERGCWSLGQACLLLLDLDPDIVDGSHFSENCDALIVEPTTPDDLRPIFSAWAERFSVLGQNLDSRKEMTREEMYNARITSVDAIAWAIENGFAVPKQLRTAVRTHTRPVGSESTEQMGSSTDADEQLLAIARKIEDRNIRTRQALSKARRYREIFRTQQAILARQGINKKGQILLAVCDVLSGEMGLKGAPPKPETVRKSIAALEKLESNLPR